LVGPLVLSVEKTSGISGRSKNKFIAKKSGSVIRIFRVDIDIFNLVSPRIGFYFLQIIFMFGVQLRS